MKGIFFSFLPLVLCVLFEQQVSNHINKQKRRNKGSQEAIRKLYLVIHFSEVFLRTVC